MLYPYFACDLELLFQAKHMVTDRYTLIMNWQYLFDSMLSVELKLYKFIIIIVIIAIIVIYTCIIFISFYNHHYHCL